MSNLGSITLAEIHTGNRSLRIEDNIGEAIYIYLDNIRMNFSVRGYCLFCKQIRDIVNNYFQDVPGFDIKHFDPLFFMKFAKDLSGLERVKFKEITLSNIYVETVDVNRETGERNIVHKPLNHSRVFKYLYGDSDKNDMSDQVKTFGMTNVEHANFMLEKVRLEGYPFDNQYIVLSGESNCICDGEHRAACLYYLYGNIKIKVMQLFFKDSDDGLDLSYLRREKLQSFIKRYKHIFIYGTGNYGMIIQKHLDECHVQSESFIVTRKKGIDVFMGKPVIEAKTIPFSPDKCGIIFGLNQQWHDEVKAHLHSLGFRNFYIYENWEIEEMRK